MKHLLTACSLVMVCSGFKADGNTATDGKVVLDYVAQGTKEPKITEAIKLVDQLFSGSDRATFMKAVAAVKDYSYTFESAANINRWMFETDITLKIRGFKGGDDTRTLAYVTSEYPGNIFINTSKLDDRSTASVAATIVHEIVHSIDRIKTDSRFGHSGNSARGKQNSAPYAIGRLARLVITRTITPTQNNKSTDVLAILSREPEVDLFVIEETEQIDESQVIR